MESVALLFWPLKSAGWRMLARVVVGFSLMALVTVAHAQDLIRDAVKQRLEKIQEPEIDLEIKAVKGEPPSPIAPQALDGYGGISHEPFAPDPEERIKWAKEEAEKRRREDLLEAKKIAAEKKAQSVAERESGAGKKSVAGKSNGPKEKRAPAGKPGPGVKKGDPPGTKKKAAASPGKAPGKKSSAPPKKGKAKATKK